MFDAVHRVPDPFVEDVLGAQYEPAVVGAEAPGEVDEELVFHVRRVISEAVAGTGRRRTIAADQLHAMAAAGLQRRGDAGVVLDGIALLLVGVRIDSQT